MKRFQQFQELTQDEQTSLTGGGFAYDFGYAIRFLMIGFDGPGGPGRALTDYFINYQPR
ncbi:MAG: hypothetical protein QM762_14205 [Chryseolinea sp.]